MPAVSLSQYELISRQDQLDSQDVFQKETNKA